MEKDDTDDYLCIKQVYMGRVFREREDEGGVGLVDVGWLVDKEGSQEN